MFTHHHGKGSESGCDQNIERLIQIGSRRDCDDRRRHNVGRDKTCIVEGGWIDRTENIPIRHDPNKPVRFIHNRYLVDPMRTKCGQDSGKGFGV